MKLAFSKLPSVPYTSVPVNKFRNLNGLILPTGHFNTESGIKNFDELLSAQEVSEVQNIIKLVSENPNIMKTVAKLKNDFPEMDAAKALEIAIATQNVETTKNDDGNFTHTFK